MTTNLSSTWSRRSTTTQTSKMKTESPPCSLRPPPPIDDFVLADIVSHTDLSEDEDDHDDLHDSPKPSKSDPPSGQRGGRKRRGIEACFA
ncbi:hypothetical protein GN958_ATG07968 [Phytophthora infestans]|uniref:Uncharacterized protein n=1 Tax=Phytophthora infestans TaxID=4787 RepID=A0A8S9UPV4_PHYIN|nr:hypothetical protein GN958_ATG07968 [Phytophthora infestans]